MIRYYTKNAKLLFCGINPHPGSDARKVPFSNNKLFWYLLSKAGLIDESVEELRVDEQLHVMYHTKYNPVYGLGFLNIIDRPTKDITLLLKGEEEAGKKKNVACYQNTEAKGCMFCWQDIL